MGLTQRRVGFAIVTTAIGATAGCAGWAVGDERDRTDGSRTKRTGTDEKTSSPTTLVRTVSLRERPPFPEGPKEKPPPPRVWNESSARSYATEYEERRLYNEYHGEDTSECTISCSVPSVEKTQE
jgi:hypothetical protein